MINIWDNPEQLFSDNRFENYENKIKDKYKIVVVGIDNNNHLFYITFENVEQARRFILKNHGDIFNEIGFYCKLFVNGKFEDENT